MNIQHHIDELQKIQDASKLKAEAPGAPAGAVNWTAIKAVLAIISKILADVVPNIPS